MTFRRIVLTLFVINLGIAFGAGLYEARVEFPQWLVASEGTLTWNAEAARRADSGLRFWALVSTLPLTLLTLLNLGVGWKRPKPLLTWWFGSACISLVERVLTFTFFIPGMLRLMQMASTPEAVQSALLWEKMNLLRHVLCFSAWMFALRAFSLSSTFGQEPKN